MYNFGFVFIAWRWLFCRWAETCSWINFNLLYQDSFDCPYLCVWRKNFVANSWQRKNQIPWSISAFRKKKLFSLKLVLVEERKHVTVELQSKKNIKMKESYQSSKDWIPILILCSLHLTAYFRTLFKVNFPYKSNR